MSYPMNDQMDYNDWNAELEQERAFWKDYDDESFRFEEYYADCEQCGSTTFADQKLCQTCREEEEDMEMLDYADTKGQRREARREKQKKGMVKHLEPSVRPFKMPKPSIKVKG